MYEYSILLAYTLCPPSQQHGPNPDNKHAYVCEIRIANKIYFNKTNTNVHAKGCGNKYFSPSHSEFDGGKRMVYILYYTKYTHAYVRVKCSSICLQERAYLEST